MKNLASLIILLFCAALVSAQQKQRIAVLPSVGDLDPKRLILLTDKVREIATQHLPIEDFNILKQDVITKMIGEEELYRACKEGVCIGDLAKRTNSNYGARGDVIKLDNSLVLKFEIYSVDEDAIFETFTVYDLKDFRAMLRVLEARLPKTFQKVVSVYNASKTNLNKIQLIAPSEPAPKADSQPLPPRIYTLTTAADPPDGGRISRSPNYSTYYADSNVTVIAIPYAGYTFAGWSGGTTSANDSVTITIDSDLTLTANFQRLPEPPPEQPLAATPKRNYTTVDVSEQDTGSRVLRKRISLEAGGIVAPYINHYEYYGGSRDDYYSDATSGVGGYLCLDLIYVEGVLDVDFGVGGIIGAFVKYPFVYRFVKVSPMLGIGAVATPSVGTYGLIFGGRIEVGSGEFAYLRSEYLYCGGSDGTDGTSFKISGGLDIGFGESQKTYLRPELMYRILISEHYNYGRMTTRSFERGGTTHSFEIRLGIGYKWGGNKKNKKRYYKVG